MTKTPEENTGRGRKTLGSSAGAEARRTLRAYGWKQLKCRKCQLYYWVKPVRRKSRRKPDDPELKARVKKMLQKERKKAVLTNPLFDGLWEAYNKLGFGPVVKYMEAVESAGKLGRLVSAAVAAGKLGRVIAVASYTGKLGRLVAACKSNESMLTKLCDAAGV